MLWRKYLKDYFSFGKRDRIGILSLLCLICLVYLLPFFFRSHLEVNLENSAELNRAIDSLAKLAPDHDYEQKPGISAELSPPVKEWKGELFRFDPNTLAIQGWQRMGLSERTCRTIENFRNKGGRFYKPEDLQKIWGLPPGFYERVKDYIVITSIEKTFEKNSFDRGHFQKTQRTIGKVHINESDTSAFIALPGIGSKLAARIISFREKLGGFYSIEQIRETYGLSDSTFQKIRPYLIGGGDVKKININTITRDELKKHPYFRWNLVNAVIEYRNQHGPFQNINDLKNIMLVDENSFQKIIHYVSL